MRIKTSTALPFALRCISSFALTSFGLLWIASRSSIYGQYTIMAAITLVAVELKLRVKPRQG